MVIMVSLNKFFIIIFKILVLQKALSCSKEPYFSKFMIFLGPLIEKLKNVSFGSKLYNKLIQNYPDIKKPKFKKSAVKSM